MTSHVLITGNLYQVKHRRKGTFVGKFVGSNGDFFQFEIVQGEASAMLDYNIKAVGETVSARGSLFTAKPAILN